jgi:hypothetical protein
MNCGICSHWIQLTHRHGVSARTAEYSFILRARTVSSALQKSRRSALRQSGGTKTNRSNCANVRKTGCDANLVTRLDPVKSGGISLGSKCNASLGLTDTSYAQCCRGVKVLFAASSGSAGSKPVAHRLTVSPPCCGGLLTLSHRVVTLFHR